MILHLTKLGFFYSVFPSVLICVNLWFHTFLRSADAAFQQYFIGLFNLAWKLFAILFLIFLILEIVQRLGLLIRFGRTRYFRFAGFTQEAVAPLLAGIFFGILYGAGVIADLIKKQDVNKKQVLLISVFLAICHAIIEDTGLFLVLGAKFFWITIPRLVIAFGITFLASKVFKENDRVKEINH